MIREAVVPNRDRRATRARLVLFLLAALSFTAAASGRARAGDDAELVVRRLVFGSCAKQDRPAPVWDAIASWQPDVTVLLGDNVYADTTDMDAMRKAYALLAAQPGFQKLRGATRLVATWDDHDMGKDDAGSDYPVRAESKKAFLDFLGEPEDSPRRQREGVYESYTFGPAGKRVQVILLDTRWFRSALTFAGPRPDPKEGRYGPYTASTDAAATVLGDAQWAWLEAELRKPADLRFLGSSIQVLSEDHGFEKWMNFPRERARLLDTIAKTHANGLIVLSGDRHAAELSALPAAGRVDDLTGERTANPLGYRLIDITASSFNSPRPWSWEVNRHRIGDVVWEPNFGTVEIDWDQPQPRLTLAIRNDRGQVAFSYAIEVSTLRSAAP